MQRIKAGKKKDESKNKERKKENTEQSENCKKRDLCIDCISKAAFVVKKIIGNQTKICTHLISILIIAVFKVNQGTRNVAQFRSLLHFAL